jgi:MoaA/NifB/PqqE/SkfB family radical SAM enzyme
MPIKHSDQNPYVDAFWKWWPELYQKLETLRLTGGEPLLSKDVWRMLDDIEANPKPDLVFAINTNLGIPDELVDRMIAKLNSISKNIKEVQIFTSGEATGAQAEYIRYGLEYDKWAKNLEKVLEAKAS